MSKLSRKTKDILFVSGLVACLVLAIGGFGWSEYANSKFWQVGWNVLGGLGVVGFVGGIYWKSQQRTPKQEGQQ